MIEIIIPILILILALIHHEYAHLFVLQLLGHEGKIIIKKHKYPIFNTFGVIPQVKTNVICARDIIIVRLAPIPTGIVLFSCAFIFSAGCVSLLAIMLGVSFALFSSCVDIFYVIKIYKWWIKPSKNPDGVV